MQEIGNATALFVADTHFRLRPDAAERRRLERFLFLLDRATTVRHLVLAGDIFDFWFDYPHFRLKGYEEVLQALDAVRAAGTRIHFVGGNHDIWAAPYLAERYGCEPGGGALDLLLDGLRVRVDHGDGMLGKDWLYGTFRAVVRQPAGVALAKSLHPELLYAFSRWLSGVSRQATREEAAAIEAKARRWLSRQAAGAWDLLVMGHLHHPFLLRRDGLTLAALGGWLDRQGYGRLADGRFELRELPRGRS